MKRMMGSFALGAFAAVAMTFSGCGCDDDGDDDDKTGITISIDDVTLAEGDAGTTDFDFTVTISAAPTAGSDVTVDVATSNGTATAGTDYTAVATTTLTFTFGGALTQTVTVAVSGDTDVETDEAFNVDLTNAANATIADALGLGTITNDDASTISIDDVAIVEGDAGTTDFVFTVTVLCNPMAGSDVTVDVATSDGTATAGVDYTAVATTTLTFTNAGPLTQTVTVVVSGDASVEANETFNVDLTNAGNATITDALGVGTILNDDGGVLSIDDVSLAEGDAGTTSFDFTVTITVEPTVGNDVTVDVATSDDTATAGVDYTAVATTVLTFTNGGPLTQTVTVVVSGDTDVEADETFNVNLTNAANATIVDALGVGTITNDDASTISIDDVTVAEGDAGTTDFVFTVTVLCNPMAGSDVTVDVATSDGTATAGVDYTAVTTTMLTFTNAGPLTQTVTVVVSGDTDVEANETFNVNLTNAANATITDALGVGTITNEDASTISIDDVTLAEGDAGTTDFVFTVTVLGNPMAGSDVTLDVATSDVTATAGVDYTAVATTMLTFTNAGPLTQTVTVVVSGDTDVEANETFNVDLSNAANATITDALGVGTITNDDASTISIDDVAIDEGDAGTTDFVFTVTVLCNPMAGSDVTVDVATSDGTATAGVDYTAVATTMLTFTNAGPLTQTVTVIVSGDTDTEPDETFDVVLSNATNATISDDTGVGTIINDEECDLAPTDTALDVGTGANGENVWVAGGSYGDVDYQVVELTGTCGTTVDVEVAFYLNDGMVQYLLGTDTIAAADLEAGETYNGTVSTLVVPSNVPDGMYYLSIEVDPSGLVTESNTGNNAAVDNPVEGVLVFALGGAVPGIDLVIENIRLETYNWEVVEGEQAVFQVYVVNRGNVDATGDIVVAIKLDDGDWTVEIADPDLATQQTQTGGLAAGEEMMFTFTCDVPVAGAGYGWGAIVDPGAAIAEVDELNNFSWVSTFDVIVTGGEYINLSCRIDMPLTPEMEVGGSVLVALGLGIESNTSVGAFDVTFYLSTDETLDVADVLIGTESIPAMLAGEYGAITGEGVEDATWVTLTVPGGTTVGTYYVLMAVDDADGDGDLSDGGAVTEDDETDNVESFGSPPVDLVAAGTGLPDLLVLIGDPGRPMPTIRAAVGETFAMAYITANFGAIDVAAGQDLSFFLSADATYLPAGDIELTGAAVTLPAQLAGQVYFEDGPSMTIPGGTALGTYTLYAYIDVNDSVAEIHDTGAIAPDFDNNASPNGFPGMSEPTVITIIAVPDTTPDLAGSFEDDVDDVPIGGFISCDMTVMNVAVNVASDGFLVTFYVSDDQDATIYGDDVYLGYSECQGGLPPLGSSWQWVGGTEPIGVAGGPYYLKATIDYLNAVTESDETNNIAVSTDSFNIF